MDNSKIDRIECVPLIGTRPREAGCNSRLQVHGLHVRPPIVRITTDAGATGFGVSRMSEQDAASLVGAPLSEAFDLENGVSAQFRALEYPLWDLAGKLAGKPVYEMLGGDPDADGVFRARCYDTSLYIDDLHLADDDEAAALIASEALEGKARGHKAYKIKVGRGAMHMSLQQGTHRDILVIRAVRNVVGADATILIDANNGYNLNLTKQVLSETADAKVYWMEEAFHEDGSFYANLKEWLNSEGIETKIADGEGGASLNLLQWAEEGLVDIIQYDIFHPGFTRWLELGPQLDEWNVGSAPHHYGGHYGNYVSCHLSAAIRGFEFVEWDQADTPGLDDSGYSISDGLVSVPNSPGFGLNLDEEIYARALQENGFDVRAAQ